MHARINIVILLGLVALLSISLWAAGKVPSPQTLCPVMGNEINKEVYVDIGDRRVFFCCAGCIDAFNKEPQKYLDKMKNDGVELMKLVPQSRCPVMDKPIDRKHFVDVEGKRIFVCCPGCKEKVAAEPQKYMKLVAERGEYLEALPKEK